MRMCVRWAMGAGGVWEAGRRTHRWRSRREEGERAAVTQDTRARGAKRVRVRPQREGEERRGMAEQVGRQRGWLMREGRNACEGEEPGSWAGESRKERREKREETLAEKG